MKIAIRAQYPAAGGYSWEQALDDLAPIESIELAFYRPEDFTRFVKQGDVVDPIRARHLHVPTIHMAHASLTNLGLFFDVLIETLRIAGALGCQQIVIHPSRGQGDELGVVFDRAILPLLEEYDCELLWETFLGKRRILTAWDQLAEFCRKHGRSFICYDVCHMQRRTAEEVIEDIDQYGDLIGSYHFSNWRVAPMKQHLPVGEGLLDYQKIVKHLVRCTHFEGSATLEYLPEYHDRLVADALKLRGWIDGGR